MPISFQCSQCSKAYNVSDHLAGKNAQCKQCGNRMIVPSASATSPSPSRPAAAPTRPSAAPVSRPKPMPGTTTSQPKRRVADEPDADDVYGFNEAPSALPPISRPGSARDDDDELPKPAKKKKKKGGFFSSSPAKPSSGRGGGDSISGLRLIGIIIGVLAGLGGAIRGFGLLSKSDVMALGQRNVARFNQLTNQLRAVRDISSARAASGPCNKILNEMYDDMNTNGRKKAREADIKAVLQEIRPQLQFAGQQFESEARRVGMIPGAGEALNLDANIQRISALELELQAQNPGPGFN